MQAGNLTKTTRQGSGSYDSNFVPHAVVACDLLTAGLARSTGRTVSWLMVVQSPISEAKPGRGGGTRNEGRNQE